MRTVVEAVIALSPSPNGFTASDIAARVRERCAQYGPRHAAYDLKKLRGKQIVRRIGHTRRYEPLASGLRAITPLIVLRNKAIKPLLAAARPLPPPRGELNPKPLHAHPPPGPPPQPAASSTPNPSMPTTTPCGLPCRASSTNSASPLDDRRSTTFLSGFAPKRLRPTWDDNSISTCYPSTPRSPGWPARAGCPKRGPAGSRC